MIPYGRQTISEKDISAVVEVLRSDYLTQGNVVPEFELALSQYCGARYGITTNSATSALHLACLALGLGDQDWLWTTPISFVASANCGRYCGANVDFVDIDPQTYNLSVDALKRKLETARQSNKLPKVLVAVHLAGQSCHMREISSLAKEYGFSIIEDASHAVGGKYLGKPIGSCEFSDISIFSFHPVKVITSAEGGMLVTNSSELAENLALLRSHGITRDASLMSSAPDGEWYYEQIDLGFNYRMSDVHAALGLSQLVNLDDFIARRHSLAKRYDEQLEQLPLMLPYQDPGCYSAYHLYIIRLKLDKLTKTRRQVFTSLRESGIGVNVHYIPIHRQPYYQNTGIAYDPLPHAERYYEEAISLPLFPDLSLSSQDQVTQALVEALQ